MKQPDKLEDTVYRKAVQMLLAYFVPKERYAEAVDGLRRLPPAADTNVATTDTFCKIKDRIMQEIDELKENGVKHSDDVRQNGLLIAEGLWVALQIIREVKEENDEETNKTNSIVGNRNE